MDQSTFSAIPPPGLERPIDENRDDQAPPSAEDILDDALPRAGNNRDDQGPLAAAGDLKDNVDGQALPPATGPFHYDGDDQVLPPAAGPLHVNLGESDDRTPPLPAGPNLPQQTACLHLRPETEIRSLSPSAYTALYWDALAYMNLVSRTVQPNEYVRFFKALLEYRYGGITPYWLSRRVRLLFSSYPDLIEGFNAFLPTSCRPTRVRVDDEAPPRADDIRDDQRPPTAPRHFKDNVDGQALPPATGPFHDNGNGQVPPPAAGLLHVNLNDPSSDQTPPPAAGPKLPQSTASLHLHPETEIRGGFPSVETTGPPRALFSDAIAYMNLVRRTVQPNEYARFFKALQEYKYGGITLYWLSRRARLLFSSYPDLIEGFNAFLPTSYRPTRVRVDDEAPPRPDDQRDQGPAPAAAHLLDNVDDQARPPTTGPFYNSSNDQAPRSAAGPLHVNLDDPSDNQTRPPAARPNLRQPTGCLQVHPGMEFTSGSPSTETTAAACGLLSDRELAYMDLVRRTVEPNKCARLF